MSMKWGKSYKTGQVAEEILQEMKNGTNFHDGSCPVAALLLWNSLLLAALGPALEVFPGGCTEES